MNKKSINKLTKNFWRLCKKGEWHIIYNHILYSTKTKKDLIQILKKEVK